MLTASVAMAGGTSGPYFDRDDLIPQQYVEYRLRFTGSEDVIVIVKGDNNGDIDCYVDDEDGKRITLDDDNQDGCMLKWVPVKTSIFKVRVVNHGKKRTYFTLGSN